MIVRLIRTGSCVASAIATALVGWVWFNAPHDSSAPSYHLSATYNTGVGMVDLYLLHDVRGFERLVALDPTLQAIGGDAARSVAVDDAHFPLDVRVGATKLLAEQAALDEGLVEGLALAALAHGESAAFCDIEPALDARLDCGS